MRDIVQDWWCGQVPDSGLTVRDAVRRDAFEPLREHLGTLHEMLKWCGEAAGAVTSPVDVEPGLQGDTLHVLDDDHVLLRLPHGVGPQVQAAAAG